MKKWKMIVSTIFFAGCVISAAVSAEETTNGDNTNTIGERSDFTTADSEDQLPNVSDEYEEILGSWEAESVDLGGTVLTTAELGADFLLNIEKAKIKATSDSMNFSEEFSYTISNGIVKDDHPQIDLTAELLPTGKLLINLKTVNGDRIVYYAVRANGNDQEDSEADNTTEDIIPENNEIKHENDETIIDEVLADKIEKAAQMKSGDNAPDLTEDAETVISMFEDLSNGREAESPDEIEIPTEEKTMIVARNANMRDAPHGEFMRVIPSGTTVKVLGTAGDNNDWYQVELYGITGYVYQDLLRE